MVGQDYFAAAPNDATQRTKAIVLLTDIFGLPLPNPRILADQLAEQVGVDVWVPDFFNGASHITSIYSTFGGRLILEPCSAQESLLLTRILWNPYFPTVLVSRSHG
jgi:dienelactone hydrolase